MFIKECNVVFMSIANSNNIFLLQEIVKKNFSSKYKDSVLGIFWSILKPLLIMIVFTIIFSTLFGRSIENFPVYFLSARCLFDFFNSAIAASMNSIKGNQNILKRTAAPKHIFILGSIISEFINFFITLIILVGVMIVTHAPFYFNTIPYAFIPVLALTMMIIGIGFVVAILCVYYSDIQHLWGVISLVLMYSSAMFYPMDIIPEPYYSYMILNPLFWVIDQFRHFVIWGTIPNTLNIINLLLFSLIILVFGVIIYKKYEDRVSKRF